MLTETFRGFRDPRTVFEFVGGGSWRQDEYKDEAYYGGEPRARVIEDRMGYRLEVDGMHEQVQSFASVNHSERYGCGEGTLSCRPSLGEVNISRMALNRHRLRARGLIF